MVERREILEKYLPPHSINLVIELMEQWKFQLKITRNRASKVGDYRPPSRGKSHRISVNHDLNPYSFLVTLVHEIAHLVAYEKFRRSIDPHGKEWRQEYRKLLVPFTERGILPDDIVQSFEYYFDRDVNRTDLEINEVLRKYDLPKGLVQVCDLPENAMFKLADGRLFVRGERIRTRYRCNCLTNRKTYLVSKLMEVYPVHYQYKLEFVTDF